MRYAADFGELSRVGPRNEEKRRPPHPNPLPRSGGEGEERLWRELKGMADKRPWHPVWEPAEQEFKSVLRRSLKAIVRYAVEPRNEVMAFI